MPKTESSITPNSTDVDRINFLRWLLDGMEEDGVTLDQQKLSLLEGLSEEAIMGSIVGLITLLVRTELLHKPKMNNDQVIVATQNFVEKIYQLCTKIPQFKDLISKDDVELAAAQSLRELRDVDWKKITMLLINPSTDEEIPTIPARPVLTDEARGKMSVKESVAKLMRMVDSHAPTLR